MKKGCEGPSIAEPWSVRVVRRVVPNLYSHTVLQAIKVFADYLALAPPDQLKQASD